MSRIFLLAVALVLLAAPNAPAQTLAASAIDGTGAYVQQYDVPVAAVFDIAVWMDPAGSGSSAIEFGFTDLPNLRPGLIRTGVWTIVPILILPPCDNDQCIFSFGECIAPADPLTVVRLSYIDTGFFTGPDVVFSVGPASPASVIGPSGPMPAFVDCDQNLVGLTPGGTSGGVTGSGVTFANGSVVLNPTPVVVGNERPSFSRMKARFD